MKFVYQARDSQSNLRTGEITAQDRIVAERMLSGEGLSLTSLKVKHDFDLGKIILFGRSVPNKELVLFSKQLATMAGARIPIIKALRILSEQIQNSYFASVLRELTVDVESGQSLSAAMSKYSNVFGPIYINLVKSGELSGTLNKTLTYLAEQLEKNYQLQNKVKGALTYPTFVILTLFAVGFLMFKFVLPKLTELLTEQGGSLPLASRIIIIMTGFINVYWWLVLALLIILLTALSFFIRTPLGRSVFDAAKLRMPVGKNIFQKLYLSRFTRNLSTLIAGGIPIIQALETIADIIGNVHYKNALTEVSRSIAAGKSISEAISTHDEFPPIVSQMIRVGEESGELADILNKLAKFYETEVEEQVAALASLIEPIIMVILGTGIGVLVAGILLPIYNLASSIG